MLGVQKVTSSNLVRPTIQNPQKPNKINGSACVRALTGAMLALEWTCDEDVSRLRESLNGVTRYKLPIGAGVLKNAKEWRIYETA